MRTFSRCLVLSFVLALTIGPSFVLAAPLSRGPSLEAPRAPASALLQALSLLVGSAVVFGAIRIKDTGSLAKKFATRAAAASGDYKEGVAQAGGDWEQNAAASEGNYEQGVQESIGRKAFGKGIRTAGAAHYVKRASELGSVRYGPGVQAGTDRWAQNTGPYLQMIAGLTLPPKGPRRSPQNQQRANAVAMALGNMRTGR